MASSGIASGKPRLYGLWRHLALRQLRRRFSRTALGPLWVPLTFAVYLFVMAFAAMAVVGSDMSIVPHIAVGLALWLYFTTAFTEASTIFISNKAHLLNAPLPYSVFFLSNVAANVVMLFMYMAVSAIAIWMSGIRPTMTWLWLLLTLPLTIGFTTAVSLILAVLSPKLRDLMPVVNSVMILGMFVTPIWWRESDVGRFGELIRLNPLTHYMEAVREPVLGRTPPTDSLIISGVLFVVFGVLAIGLFRSMRARLPFAL